jgi:hypothetical protein
LNFGKQFLCDLAISERGCQYVRSFNGIADCAVDTYSSYRQHYVRGIPNQ